MPPRPGVLLSIQKNRTDELVSNLVVYPNTYPNLHADIRSPYLVYLYNRNPRVETSHPAGARKKPV